ncbi:methyltransferase domain-containing protein [Pullulanibacillus sp. KACC 23026]|uniref:methyltransferase domain-containing protein n=1 Tax=Pullulanibacillus sp. KACC 23026 TaxID=3028315 RepID=UPI0023B0F2BF|nr:methyltransferase domain-containing protein [Pullulanibacillus sp. KACC 23026]WEG12510.1 methyltransferase domain-containing protein [Pullulanibacillus sp. KACC 23026]
MAIDFHNENNRMTYALRTADPNWLAKVKELVNPEGQYIIDIGCGGGIYTRAFADMGAAIVKGVDFSLPILTTARETSVGYPQVEFCEGNALDTKLESNQFDTLLERALIHHITDLEACFKEAHRLLKPGGVCLIQDRTPEDCLLEGSPAHLRGYFFSAFPKLKEKEIKRRYDLETVVHALEATGFQVEGVHKLWEVRKTYENIEELEEDLLNRTGRSILYDLSNEELGELVSLIVDNVKEAGLKPIIEKDRWTIWKAVKR